MTSSIFENFKTSGYRFSENENLDKYRYSLLNINLAVATFFAGVSITISSTGLSTFDPTYERILLFCTVMYAICIYPLRISKRLYLPIANLTIIISLVLFYAALITTYPFLPDEFRLIWFFLVVFASFIYMGKLYGTCLAVLVTLSIGVINHYIDLGFSEQGLITFYLSFIMFNAFAYNFLSKVENDEVEFRKLNFQLEKKVKREVLQRQQQEQMLLQQYRMANMGSMMDAIAHQWRQPLMNINAILMNMDNAISDIQSNKKIYLEDKMDDLSLLTEHMSQTIEDFRGLLKVRKDKTQFNITTALNEVLKLLKSSLDEVAVHIEDKSICEVDGHKSEFMQVVIIMLSNAIEVLNNRQIEHKTITIEVSRVKDNAVVSIEDNAGGIKDENMRMIFDPYFTTKEQSGGTGLGLYIAKIIAQQRMDGKITVSNNNDGAKFILSFPIGQT